MRLFSEHKPFSVIVAMQYVVMVLGTMGTGAILKVCGYPDSDIFR